MRTNVKRLLAALCGVIVLCSGMGLIAHAEEALEVQTVSEYQELTGDNVAYGIYDITGSKGAKAAMLANCSLSIAVDENGVCGTIKTGSTVTASKIGIKDIKIEKYVNGSWTLIASNSGGYTTNDNAYVMTYSSSWAEKGAYYRAKCTHYADLPDGRHELYNVTGGVKY